MSSVDQTELFATIVASAKSGSMSPSRVAELANQLADSGSRLDEDAHSADIASTGGPTSLSTLVGPLILGSLGFRAVAIGVPGRPAGAIDVLGTIPGYRTEVPYDELQTLARTGPVHVEAGKAFTPMDAALFRYRQSQGAQDLPELVCASLLSKKLAAGNTQVILDARVAEWNNFGITAEAARANARLFLKVSRMLGLRCAVFLTDGRVPYQPFVGRGEALLALHKVVFEEIDSAWLGEHVTEVTAMAMALEPPSETHLRTLEETMRELLRNHGSSLDHFAERADEVAASARVEVCAPRAGFAHFNLPVMRSLIVDANQRADVSPGAYPDMAGFELLKGPTHHVEKGEALVRARGVEDNTGLGCTFRINDAPQERFAIQAVN